MSVRRSYLLWIRLVRLECPSRGVIFVPESIWTNPYADRPPPTEWHIFPCWTKVLHRLSPLTWHSLYRRRAEKVASRTMLSRILKSMASYLRGWLLDLELLQSTTEPFAEEILETWPDCSVRKFLWECLSGSGIVHLPRRQLLEEQPVPLVPLVLKLMLTKSSQDWF